MSPKLIKQRQQIILEAHASNLIENRDMGSEYLSELLELAKQNISNEESERIALTRIFQRYQVP